MKEDSLRRVKNICRLPELAKTLMGIATVLAGICALPNVSIAQLPGTSPTPGTASATAELNFTITSPGWSLGRSEIADSGGNYDQAGAFNPFITCAVTRSGVIKSKSGTLTWIQHFVWSGVDPAGNLMYSTAGSSQAYIEFTGQAAHAKVKHQWFQSLPNGDEISIANVCESTITPGTPALAMNPKQTSSSLVIGNGTNFIATVTVEADCSTP